MKSRVIVAVLALSLLVAGSVQAQVDATVDPAVINLGFMNVFNLPAPDGDGAFVFASGWGIADLTATYMGDVVTLGPNTIGDPDPFWYIGGGGPGAPGNKIMEANLYAEVNDLGGQTINFSFEVLANTLTSAHTVKAFIKDFAPDYSSFVESSIPLTVPGTFTISLDAINEPGRHMQWGFQMTGVNVWITDVDPFGTIVIGPYTVVSTETSSWGDLKALYR